MMVEVGVEAEWSVGSVVLHIRSNQVVAVGGTVVAAGQVRSEPVMTVPMAVPVLLMSVPVIMVPIAAGMT